MTDENQRQERQRLYAEDVNGSTIQLELKRHRLYPARFATMFEGSFSFLAGVDRPACYYRVLMQCLHLMDPTQFRRISAREISEASKLSHISAQRGLAMLQADRVIIGKGRGASRAYRLNNSLCSMTSSEKWNAQTRDPEVIDGRGR